ncbi:hypothetical protein ACH347_30980 [Saccharopolyspora sp. 5N102]|uniref:hypothetical protein n=1 Tax=Saccharopolyspora sp. 5N102 TaxID=3375155 RepID=UPI0037A567D1
MAEDVSADAHENGVRRADLRRARARVVGVLSNVVRWVGNAGAALLAIHVVFAIGGANPDNGIAKFVASWAELLALGFEDLFMPDDPKLAVAINYGIAALFWLIATAMAVRILRAIA